MTKTRHSGGQSPKRILIIYNPTAGRFRLGRFTKVMAELERLGCKLTVKRTTQRGDAESFARSADPTRVDAVVAAGGDGTISEVVNGLNGCGLPLGIIPLGTANVLAAEIGLSRCPQAIATVIADGARLRCHLGLANGHLFMMMAGVGFDANVVKTVSPVLKRLIGKGAYVWAAIRELLRHAPDRYQVTLEGRTTAAASVVIGKGRFYGGRYTCTPDARLGRPSFQVCLFKSGGRRATLKYILKFLSGKIPWLEDVTLVETDQVRIEGRPGDFVQGDGDIIACLPLDVDIAQESLDLLVPA